jgi:uncharacterized membrane protein
MTPSGATLPSPQVTTASDSRRGDEVHESAATTITSQKIPRISSIDILRGTVMLLMALDHVRDYFSNVRFDPTDLTQTTATLFLTRWVTHFCAPVFVFLAGMGAYLSIARGKSIASVSRFLWTRGLVLVALEFTVVRFAWLFNFSTNIIFVQVIWVLGVSMICLAGLVYLPRKAIAVIAIVMIAGHNALDGIALANFGPLGMFWRILHVSAPVTFAPNRVFFPLYPLIPWIGVMALGFVAGGLMLLDSHRRITLMLRIGLGMMGAFAVLRAVNLYGDLFPWSGQKDGLFTFFSFINVTKYPPSLDYLLITIGSAFLALAFFERGSGVAGKFLLIFGRVPMFFYIIHIYLIHGAALLVGVLMGFPAQSMMDAVWGLPPEYGFGLGVVYAVWILVILALYPACLWFGGLKKRSTNKLLGYI